MGAAEPAREREGVDVRVAGGTESGLCVGHRRVARGPWVFLWLSQVSGTEQAVGDSGKLGFTTLKTLRTQLWGR